MSFEVNDAEHTVVFLKETPFETTTKHAKKMYIWDVEEGKEPKSLLVTIANPSSSSMMMLSTLESAWSAFS